MNTLLVQAAATPPDESIRYIPLSQGKFAIVDAVDFDWLNQWKWCAKADKRTLYAVRSVVVDGKKTTQRMHRFITGVTDDAIKVDHWDNDGLNNRRSNLRTCSDSQNKANSLKYSTSGRSRFKGVVWDKTKWQAKIQHNGKTHHVGRFSEEVEAAKAYDRAALEHFGKFARINFPSSGL